MAASAHQAEPASDPQLSSRPPAKLDYESWEASGPALPPEELSKKPVEFCQTTRASDPRAHRRRRRRFLLLRLASAAFAFVQSGRADVRSWLFGRDINHALENELFFVRRLRQIETDLKSSNSTTPMIAAIIITSALNTPVATLGCDITRQPAWL